MMQLLSPKVKEIQEKYKDRRVPLRVKGVLLGLYWGYIGVLLGLDWGYVRVMWGL